MEIEVSRASSEEKSILKNLMQLYLHEMSELNNEGVENSGLYSYSYLDYYWTESHRYPFLVRIDGELAGFVLLRKGTYFSERDMMGTPGMLIAEFFVMRKYRRREVGTYVAIHLFNRFPGRWEVAQESTNKTAQAFWRKLIAEYSEGNFTEFNLDDERWRGPVQVFDNSRFP